MIRNIKNKTGHLFAAIMTGRIGWELIPEYECMDNIKKKAEREGKWFRYIESKELQMYLYCTYYYDENP